LLLSIYYFPELFLKYSIKSSIKKKLCIYINYVIKKYQIEDLGLDKSELGLNTYLDFDKGIQHFSHSTLEMKKLILAILFG
tara:strand:- start:202 stop:444 length:243 start_codon:yes stop_codon:yes gene_type:complete